MAVAVLCLVRHSRQQRDTAKLQARLENEQRNLETSRNDWETRLNNLTQDHQQEVADLRHQLAQASTQTRDLSTTIARLHAEQKAAADTIQSLKEIRAHMQALFHETATKALQTQGKAFSDSHQKELQTTLTPLREHVGQFQKLLAAANQETIAERARLKEHISQLSARSDVIAQETLDLTNALKGDTQKQGAWGEMVLQTILEKSGLREGEEYETQAHRTSEDGRRLRPDVVIRLPGGRTLIIDSKVSLKDYSETVGLGDDAGTAAARKRHVASLRKHIDGLAKRNYQGAEAASVDYIVMFVPVESALALALQQENTLTEYAVERNVMIATPTTLMAMLRTVSHLWAVERRSQNAEEIAKRAGRLYDKVEGFISNMEMMGKRLEQAQEAHQKAFGQLSRGSGNLLWQVVQLKSLGARTSKTIEADFDGKTAPLETTKQPSDIPSANIP
ncbi:MAG: DNA recombination protein RmuC [Rhodobacteraceae bacterium]|nr:DNA recombination protein RmuC [Paracoccaceae bacterium]